MSNKRNALLALFAIGVFAYIKYNNMTPVEQVNLKKRINKAIEKIKCFGDKMIRTFSGNVNND